MATTADSPSSPQMPGGGESINSPLFRRKNLSSAWAQVVRGESESISAVHHHQTQLLVSQPELAAPLSNSSPPKMASPSPPPDAGEGSDGGNDGNVARPKKLAWKKPSNAPSNSGVVEVSPVMGAFSWPALFESTKASPISPLYFPVPDPLPVLLLKQIDYYFSDTNLVKDYYLRSNMDDQGWVPIALIASFPRVRRLTTNVQLILDSLRSSIVVEVQDDKVRRHNEWKKWKPASSRIPSDSGSVSPIKSKL